MIFRKLKKMWQSLRYYVIADPADNSVTLSKALFRHMKSSALEGSEACVFVFSIPADNTFGFMVNPDFDKQTQLCNIQYNERFHCVGFETLCPSVGRILYDYGIGESIRVKLSVSVRKTPQGKMFYQFEKPHEKRFRKHTEA